jgi:Arc/MetJ-type ribon-helix-helix transcriptional regulator
MADTPDDEQNLPFKSRWEKREWGDARPKATSITLPESEIDFIDLLVEIYPALSNRSNVIRVALDGLISDVDLESLQSRISSLKTEAIEGAEKKVQRLHVLIGGE